jgi:hypothetical protein
MLLQFWITESQPNSRANHTTVDRDKRDCDTVMAPPTRSSRMHRPGYRFNVSSGGIRLVGRNVHPVGGSLIVIPPPFRRAP